MSLYENYEALPPLSEEELTRIHSPVFDVVRHRTLFDYDTRYDHFKMDWVGKVSPLVMQGGVTDRGQMLYIERMPGVDPLEWTANGIKDNHRAYKVSLANMHDNNSHYDGNWEKTFVIRAEQVSSSQRSPGQAMTSIYLSNSPFDRPPTETAEHHPHGSVARHLAERAIHLAEQEWWANKPRIVITSHMTRLYMPKEAPEMFHPWSEVDYQLEKYGPRIAKMLLQETIELTAVA